MQRRGGRIDCGALSPVTADEPLLRIVLKNLISNGLKFSRRGVPPVVSIAVETGTDEHRLHVTDNGIGIETQEMGKLFQPFQRLHLRREYEGNGLGLAIADEIARVHGTHLQLDNGAEGRGLRVRLTLDAIAH